MSNVGFLSCFPAVVHQLKSLNPDLIYLCDPVLGDSGHLYVPGEFVQIYKEQLLPLADIITPNQTEAELLYGQPIKNLQEAERACQWFHQLGIKLVIITSLSLSASTTMLPDKDESNDTITIIASESASDAYYLLSIPSISGYWSGTGDLMAALLLAWFHRDRSNLAVILESTVTSIQAILHNSARNHSKELNLVQSKQEILQPNLCPQQFQTQRKTYSVTVFNK